MRLPVRIYQIDSQSLTEGTYVLHAGSLIDVNLSKEEHCLKMLLKFFFWLKKIPFNIQVIEENLISDHQDLIVTCVLCFISHIASL